MTPRFDPFSGEAPRWFAIEAHRPFLEDLASGVLDWLGDQAPETLSDAVVLLPNRRAARAFTEALSARAEGRTLLLPQVRPLGDLEEDEPPFAPGDLELDLPPAISPLQRRFELARMIADHHAEPLPPLLALEMAEETDRRVAELPLDRMAPLDPASPIYPVRGDHRGEHLDEIEAALRLRS